MVKYGQLCTILYYRYKMCNNFNVNGMQYFVTKTLHLCITTDSLNCFPLHPWKVIRKENNEIMLKQKSFCDCDEIDHCMIVIFLYDCNFTAWEYCIKGFYYFISREKHFLFYLDYYYSLKVLTITLNVFSFLIELHLKKCFSIYGQDTYTSYTNVVIPHWLHEISIHIHYGDKKYFRTDRRKSV